MFSWSFALMARGKRFERTRLRGHLNEVAILLPLGSGSLARENEWREIGGSEKHDDDNFNHWLPEKKEQVKRKRSKTKGENREHQASQAENYRV